MTEPTPRTRFRRADDRINKLVSDPLIADDVRAPHRTRDRQPHLRRGLADIRKASNLTQQQVAAALDTDQAQCRASNAATICCCRPCGSTSPPLAPNTRRSSSRTASKPPSTSTPLPDTSGNHIQPQPIGTRLVDRRQPPTATRCELEAPDVAGSSRRLARIPTCHHGSACRHAPNRSQSLNTIAD